MIGQSWARAACSLALAGSPAASDIAWAQEGAPPVAPLAYIAGSASPFGEVAISNEEAANVVMPELSFTPTDLDARNFDKYYYFYRSGTDFATAYADIVECDGYARGLSAGLNQAYAQAPYPNTYTMAGAVGGMIGNAIADAIVGSAERRRARRINMRQCMSFKGYERHGLSKALWQKFNFEEGLTGVSEEERQRLLKQQALVAATARPDTKELGR